MDGIDERRKTGFDEYVEKRMENEEFKKGYEEAKECIQIGNDYLEPQKLISIDINDSRHAKNQKIVESTGFKYPSIFTGSASNLDFKDIYEQIHVDYDNLVNGQDHTFCCCYKCNPPKF